MPPLAARPFLPSEPLRQLFVALAATALAALARLLVYGLVGTKLPFLTFFPAIIAAVLLGGWASGLLTALLCAVVSLAWVEPVGVFRMSTTEDFLGLTLFLFTGLLIVAMGHWLNRSRQVAERSRRDALRATAEAVEAGSVAQETLESITDAFLSVDREGGFTFINSAAERVLETPAAQLANEGLQRLFARFGNEARAQLNLAMREQMPVEFEVCDEARGRWLQCKVYPRRAGQVSVSFRDVTAQWQARREREDLLTSERTARSELERLNRLKDEFLATVSHELRTPLNAILGWAQLLKQDVENPETVSEGVEVIERNSRAQAQLIGDLLDMSRIISGKVRLEMRPVDLGAVIESAMTSVLPSAEARQVRLTKAPHTTSLAVTGDAGRLQQVLWNLLSNAIKFTSPGGRVDVLLEQFGAHARISVSDTGQGIAPEFLPHVFDRFRQADGSTTRRHGGLGIGLAIVKNLVEMHGGSVEAHSAGLGQGASFVVNLPLRAAHDTSQPPVHPGEPQRQLPFDLPQLDGVRVLVVDDEPDSRQVVKRLLSERGATIETAASADEGLEAIERQVPDVILSDIGMPDRDGYDFMRALRRAGVSVPAVALTALVRAEDRLKAIHAGYQIHLPKPVEPAELVTVVASLAGRLDSREN